MIKPITKIASDATHGSEDVGSPAAFVNKANARSPQMIHKSWPKFQQGTEDGSEYAKVLASENQDLPVEANEECEEGYIKDEKGQCQAAGENLANNDTEINTDGGTGGTGALSNADTDQSGGDG